MKSLRFILLMVVALVAVGSISAQQQESIISDVKIMFDINSSVVDRNFGDNANTFEVLDRILLNSDETHKLESIDVMSSSSIDGSYILNRRLAEERIASVRSFLKSRYYTIPQSLFKYIVLGENWEDLRACVVADLNVPYKSRVLEVIDNNSAYDDKEVEFKNIHDGASWDYMKEHIFPLQRYGVGVVFILKEEYRPKPEPEPAPEPEPEPVVEEPAPTPVIEPVLAVDDRMLIALKTNLLADIVTAINLEVEVPIGERYSVSGEFKFPWWRSTNADFTMQILSGHIEGKYWFGERTKENRLLGWSAGVFTGFGTYDIQPLSKSGASGDFLQLGIIGGYSHSIFKNFNLEYEIGLGYIHSGYRLYDMADVEDYGYVKVMREECKDGKIYKNTVLPTRLKVSLVWMLDLHTLGL